MLCSFRKTLKQWICCKSALLLYFLFCSINNWHCLCSILFFRLRKGCGAGCNSGGNIEDSDAGGGTSVNSNNPSNANDTQSSLSQGGIPGGTGPVQTSRLQPPGVPHPSTLGKEFPLNIVFENMCRSCTYTVWTACKYRTFSAYTTGMGHIQLLKLASRVKLRA